MSRTRRVVNALAAAALLAPAVVVATADPAAAAADAVASGGYAAVIKRTSYGVPHISANSIGSVAFGQAWAYAEDRFCDLADQIVKVRGERSRWFGPGPDGANLATDFAYGSLGLYDRARTQLAQLQPEELQIVNGYVRGYNAFLATRGAARVPGWCAGQPWIAPITNVDLLAYERDIALLASGGALLAPIAAATPPSAAAALPISPALTRDGVEQLTGQSKSLSSNGWALGADKSQSGKGMLIGNPHFPWEGELRFWESQLTVAGNVNVYGASLGGLPGVQIGFTDKVAWTHTIAAGSRYTFYLMTLDPSSPTKYIVDGQSEAMTGKSVTVKVKQPNGSLQSLTRTMWSTRYGPVLDLSAIDPSLGWNGQTAISYRDANIDNDRLTRVWWNMARATDVNGLRASISRDQGIPWVNTIATDSSGNAFYVDSSPTPNLSPASLAEWSSNPLGLLDGSNSANAWVVAPGARSPGLVPFAQQPQLQRRDYVFNSNDSHWVPNANQFLTGFTPLQGPEGTPLTVRTRQNVKLINSAAKFDLAGLGTTILSGDTYTAAQLAAYTVTACRARGSRPVVVDGASVDVSPGCTVLANWDKQFELASRGAVLWRETVGAVVANNPGALDDAGALFGTPFNPADPTRTPRGGPSSPDELLAGLARAILRMRAVGLALNVPMSQVQYTVKNGQKIPVPGSTENIGIANMAQYQPLPGSSLEPFMDPGTFVAGSDLTDKGYVVNYGTSFLLTLAYTSSGPSAKCILTFSESGDSASSHYTDQTQLYSQKKLRDCRYSDSAISADTQSVEVIAATA
ncbi:penicillin acylase family protein [Dactylosporangium darangshiense]|uniref:N-acyl homoserine lactone acylase QqaR n=1 Tax=Dactylosporangium darangshiense TaxID=579108 RepID=A0ABP8DD70_9ACTN